MSPEKLMDYAPVAIAMSLLIAGAAIILLPFVPQIVWAAILVYVTRHIFWRFDKLLGRHHILSAVLFVLLIFLLIIVPLGYGATLLAVESKQYLGLVSSWVQNGIPALPHWVVSLPWVGETINEWWNKLLNGDPVLQENVKAAAVWVANFALKLVGLFGKDMGLLLFSVVIAGFIYASLDKSTKWLEVVMAKLFPGRSEELLQIVGGTVQGVVFGILGTALAQAVLVMVGLVIVDMPSIVLLGTLTFVLALIPAGPTLVWIPVSVWLFYQGETGYAIFMFMWGMLVVSTIDNLIKPYLIGKGNDLPFVLIILGMFGGALSFGVLGIFIGPTLLALAYNLLKEWAFVPVVTPESLVNVTVNLPETEQSIDVSKNKESN